MVYVADEYYLLAGRPFPAREDYEDFAQHENGIGMARAFESAFLGDLLAAEAGGVRRGFFAAVDGAPADGYRAPRASGCGGHDAGPARPDGRRATIVTGEYGARVLEPLLDPAGAEARVLPVRNDFFGGNTAVTGLLTFEDVARSLAAEPAGDRYLLPDVCLSHGRFLDGGKPADLPRPVEVLATEGAALRRALGLAPAAGQRRRVAVRVGAAQ